MEQHSRHKKTTEQFIEEAKLTHGNKFDYSLVEYKNNKTDVIIKCNTCLTVFQQNPKSHLNGYGCKQCAIEYKASKRRKTTEQFIKEAKLIHGDKYDYSLVEYKNNKTKVIIKCNICGTEFPQRPDDHLNGKGCKVCGKIQSSKKRAKTTEQFIKEAKLIHGDKYDYSLVEYVNSDTKVKIVCHCKEEGKEHGVFEQLPFNHLGGQNCPECVKITTSKFIERAKKVHGDKFDYSLVNYINNSTKVIIKCKKCGNIFKQYPTNHYAGDGCPNCLTISKGEEKIKLFLKQKEIKFEQYKKYPNLRDKLPLSYDFYIPSKNLLIEFNGRQHYKFEKHFHKTNKDFHRQKHHDWLKRKYAKDNKIKLLTIPYWEYYNVEEILEGCWRGVGTRTKSNIRSTD